MASFTSPSSHPFLPQNSFLSHHFNIKLDDADTEVGQKHIQGHFKDFIQFWPNSRTFNALKMKQFFCGMWDVGTLTFRLDRSITFEIKIYFRAQNDPELALFKMVLPPVQLDKVPAGFYVRNGVCM